MKDSRTNANSRFGFTNQNENKKSVIEHKPTKFDQSGPVETANASIIEFTKIKTDIQVKETDFNKDL